MTLRQEGGSFGSRQRSREGEMLKLQSRGFLIKETSSSLAKASRAVDSKGIVGTLFIHSRIYSIVFYVSGIELGAEATASGQDSMVPTIVEFAFC